VDDFGAKLLELLLEIYEGFIRKRSI